MSEFTLPDLPYDHDALDPSIDERTMRIHHGKHHAGYTRKLNAALEGHEDLQDKSIEELLSSINSLPEEIQTAVRNNGGGFYNHSLFWPTLSPNGGGEPEGDLGSAIDEAFGSFEALKDEFASAASGQFGSGWAWLVVTDGGLEIGSTANQDNPVMDVSDLSGTPILGLDVWEHAYYLKYQNERGTYVENWWNVVNWDQVSENYQNAS